MISSSHLQLEPLKPAHLHHVMQWVNDREVMKYFASHQKPITREEELSYIDNLRKSKTDFAWSVFTPDYGNYIGQCSINQIYWPAKNGRIFLVITKDQQGKGYAPHILNSLIEEGRKIGLHKLWLIVREENLKSIIAYLNAGFECEGVLKDEYFVNGQYFNMVRMGLILHKFNG